MHGFGANTPPLNTPVPASEQTKFWNQCQHHSWFFLPWHRLYIFYFEQIVAQTVSQLDHKPPWWILPYWNYSDLRNPHARQLPTAFQQRHMDDGTPNPLFVEARVLGNDGADIPKPRDVDLQRCLARPDFVAQPGGDPGFGGQQTGFNHAGGVEGALEAGPHDAIHGDIGGPMGSFNTAALDPIFWLHHANIDRLWTVWLKRDPAHQNPMESGWLNEQFPFHDSAGSEVLNSASQVLDTTAAPLDYQYEDESDPLMNAPAAPGVHS